MRSNNNNSGCLTAVVSSFSRWMLLFYWIARPVQMDATFSTVLLPCFGFLFLPFTTLMYVLLQTSSVGGIQGFDWVWLILAAVLDVGTIGGAGVANRDRIPAGYPGSPQTPAAVQVPTQANVVTQPAVQPVTAVPAEIAPAVSAPAQTAPAPEALATSVPAAETSASDTSASTETPPADESA